jgi:hypothetical protein
MALEIYLKNENSVKESAWYQCWEEKINNPSFILWLINFSILFINKILINLKINKD